MCKGLKFGVWRGRGTERRVAWLPQKGLGREWRKRNGRKRQEPLCLMDPRGDFDVLLSVVGRPGVAGTTTGDRVTWSDFYFQMISGEQWNAGVKAEGGKQRGSFCYFGGWVLAAQSAPVDFAFSLHALPQDGSRGQSLQSNPPRTQLHRLENGVGPPRCVSPCLRLVS